MHRSMTVLRLRSAPAPGLSSSRTLMRRAPSGSRLHDKYTDSVLNTQRTGRSITRREKILAEHIPQGDGSLGWVANEFPRGTDVHLAKVKDGRVLAAGDAGAHHLELPQPAAGLLQGLHGRAGGSCCPRIRPVRIMCHPHDRHRRGQEDSRPETHPVRLSLCCIQRS